MKQNFFTPKLTGGRFRESTVPIEVLSDIYALQELLTEVAKDFYKKQNPERRRAPRNFDKVVQIHLAGVEEGSAKLKLVFYFAGLFPPYVALYETAKNVVTEAVAAVTRGEQPRLEQHFLRYFERIGHGLEPDESLGFPVDGGYINLNQVTRQRLIEASQVDEWSERVTFRARVSSTNVRTDRYELHLMDGTAVQGSLTPVLRDPLQETHVAYGKSKEEWILLDCTVLKDHLGRIVQVESIQDVIPLEPLDVPVRVFELTKLENGWLDGEGVAPSPEGLHWLSETFDRNYAPDLQLPYLYPTLEGNVQAEWSLDGWSASVLFDLATHKAEFEAFQPATDESREMRFDLSAADGWIALNDSLRLLAVGTVKA